MRYVIYVSFLFLIPIIAFDWNECKTYTLCSQICNVINDECGCNPGYLKDPQDHTRCNAVDGHKSLMFAENSYLRNISFDGDQNSTILSSKDVIRGFDFVYRNDMVFWIEFDKSAIYKAPFGKSSEKSVVVIAENTTSSIVDLAVDWIYEHVYWTNSDKKTIELVSFDGNMQKTLVAPEFGFPWSIAVDPIDGWMYWTDLNHRSISRSGMDGTHQEVIAKGYLRSPNCLTLDLVSRRLYWVDELLYTIFSSDFDGRHWRVVISNIPWISSPSAITVFEDTLYLSDSNLNAIIRVDRLTGSGFKIVRRLDNDKNTTYTKVRNVLVYHAHRQPNGTNHCGTDNGKCSYLCLPAPQINDTSPRVSCACPNGMELTSDGLTCGREGSPGFFYSLISSRAFFICLSVLLFTVIIIICICFYLKN